MGKPFSAGILDMYFKGKWRGTGEKDPLLGRFDNFQIRP